MGIYLYVILFVTTITAVLLVANSVSQDGIEKAIDGKPATLTIKAHGARLSDDVLVQRAHAALPNATLMYLMRPMTPDAPFVVNYEKGSYGFLRNGKLLIDPYSGKTLQIDSDRAAAAGHKTMALMEDLHYGLFGGIWTKLLYTITGLLPLGLFISGLLMWWKRKQARAKVKAIAAVK